jgi:DNA-binding transcriptional LysR family regulator
VEFRYLRYFVAVAEHQSFTRAAEKLRVAQSAISQQIRTLEEKLEVQLLFRTKRSVKLTAAGQALLREAKDIFDRIEQSTVEVRRAEGVDAAILFGEPVPSALIARRLLQVHILTCASPEYVARYGRPRKPVELESGKHECLLFRDPATGKPSPWEFHRGKKRLSVNVTGRLIVNDGLTYVALCAAGNGIAQLIDLTIEPLRPCANIPKRSCAQARRLSDLCRSHHRCLSVVRDISDRKRTEEAMRLPIRLDSSPSPSLLERASQYEAYE